MAFSIATNQADTNDVGVGNSLQEGGQLKHPLLSGLLTRGAEDLTSKDAQQRKDTSNVPQHTKYTRNDLTTPNPRVDRGKTASDLCTTTTTMTCGTMHLRK